MVFSRSLNQSLDISQAKRRVLASTIARFRLEPTSSFSVGKATQNGWTKTCLELLNNELPRKKQLDCGGVGVFSIPLCVINYIYIIVQRKCVCYGYKLNSSLFYHYLEWLNVNDQLPQRFGWLTTPINAQQMQLSPAFRQSTAYKEGCIAHENACSNKLQVSYNHMRGTFVSSLLHLHLSLFTSKKMKKMYSPLLWLFCRYETNNTIYH